MSLSLPYRINTLRGLAADMVDQTFLAELDELREKLRSGRPNLVVVGLFKRGKSSIVNALLGCTLAPIGVTPQTAIVTVFAYDPLRSFARIHFREGRSIETDIRGIGPYVSEDENPNNRKEVSIVRLFTSNSPLLQAMTLIDTPGLGSALVHNTAETLAFVPRIDAALFVLSADLPVSQSDIEFLKELKTAVPTILFVLNKSDLLTEPELQKIIAHNRQMIVSQVGLETKDVDIIPVSTRMHERGQRVAGNIDNLANALHSAVRKDDNALLHQTLERGFDRLANRLALLLTARMDTVRLPLHELESREQQLQAISRLVTTRKRDFDHLLTSETAQLTSFVRDSLQARAHELKEALPDAIRSITHLPSNKITEQLPTLSRRLLDSFEETHRQLENEITTRFQQELLRQAQQRGSFLAELIHSLAGIIPVDLTTIMEKFDLDVYAPFYLSSDGGSASPKGSSFLQRRLPASMRERLLSRQLLAHFNEIIIRNSAAVIYNLDYRIQESQRKFTAELQKRLHELVDQLHIMVADTIRLRAGYAANIDQPLQELKEKLTCLKELRADDEPIESPLNSQSHT